MKKRAPIDPNARICSCCGFANAATLSACRLCGTRLPEHQSIAEPRPETSAPPAYKPLPYRSRPPVPPAPQPLPVQNQPPTPPPPPVIPRQEKRLGITDASPLPPPPPVIQRQEKPPVIIDERPQLAKEPVALRPSSRAVLRRRIRDLIQRSMLGPALLSRLKSQLHQTSALVIEVATQIVRYTFRELSYAFRSLWSFILWLGQKSTALKPRFPSWRPRFTFRTSEQYGEPERPASPRSAAQPAPQPRLRSLTIPVLHWRPNLAPAISFGRQAFFFFAGLGGLVLKAILSALIFLLKQSHQLLKRMWSLRAARPASASTIEPTIEPVTKRTISFDLRRAARYSGVALASLAVLAILGLSFTTLQRSWAAWRATKPTGVEIKIQEDYQSASKRTLVKLEPLVVSGKQFDGLSLGASFSYSGRTLKQEPESITLLLTSVDAGFKFAELRSLMVRTDWETIKLGLVSRTAQQIHITSDGKIEAVKAGKKSGDKSNHVLETLTFNVPTATWTKIARSKEVKIKLGQTEFDLAEIHLTAWRDLLERATSTLPATKRASH